MKGGHSWKKNYNLTRSGEVMTGFPITIQIRAAGYLPGGLDSEDVLFVVHENFKEARGQLKGKVIFSCHAIAAIGG